MRSSATKLRTNQIRVRSFPSNLPQTKRLSFQVAVSGDDGSCQEVVKLTISPYAGGTGGKREIIEEHVDLENVENP